MAPLSVVIAIAVSYGLHATIFSGQKRGDPEWMHKLTAKYITFFFLITYLVLPSITTRIFGAFPCTDINPDKLIADIPSFLRNDMSIACTGPNSGRYRFGVIWASVMILVYPVGVLSIYLYTLWYNKLAIKEKDLSPVELVLLLKREARMRKRYKKLHGTEDGFVMPGRPPPPPEKGIMKYVTKTELNFLHRSYEGRCWYWEVVETGRRLLLTAVVSVVGTGTGSQIVLGIFITIVFIKLYSFYHPFLKVRFSSYK
jgi:hypothetical protein